MRWSDIKGRAVFIQRSLCQTREGLLFKGTKTEEPRKVEMPPSLLTALDAHRIRQDEFRRQFGGDYRADLDLIFANPYGSPLKPILLLQRSLASAESLGCPKGHLFMSCGIATQAFCW